MIARPQAFTLYSAVCALTLTRLWAEVTYFDTLFFIRFIKFIFFFEFRPTENKISVLNVGTVFDCNKKRDSNDNIAPNPVRFRQSVRLRESATAIDVRICVQKTAEPAHMGKWRHEDVGH